MLWRLSCQPLDSNLHAEDAMRDHELPPCAVCKRGIRQDDQDDEVSFDKTSVVLRAGGAHSESVTIGWAGAHVPEFPHVLRRETKRMILSMQILQRFPRNGGKRIVVSNCAKL